MKKFVFVLLLVLPFLVFISYKISGNDLITQHTFYIGNNPMTFYKLNFDVYLSRFSTAVGDFVDLNKFDVVFGIANQLDFSSLANGIKSVGNIFIMMLNFLFVIPINLTANIFNILFAVLGIDLRGFFTKFGSFSLPYIV